MIYVPGIELWRNDDRAAGKHRSIPLRQDTPARRPRRQKRQPRPEDGGLQLIEAGVHAAGILVMVLTRLAPVA